MTPALKAFAVCGALALAAISPAHASPAEPVRVAVSYADLDLGTVEGREALEKRIENAAREMCGLNDAPTTGSRIPSHSKRACFEKATSQIGESIARAIEKRENKG